MLKFYCYHFTADKTTPQIIADIKTLCEQTAQFEREEDIMLFVFVPAVSLEAVCEQMSRTPPWAEGLLLRADGYVCEFYQKD